MAVQPRDRFGFNTTTVKTWAIDRLKGFLLAVLLGVSIARAGVEAVRVDRPNLVDLGSGRGDHVPIASAADRPCVTTLLFNKFTPLPPGSPLCANAYLRWRKLISNRQHPSSGRQQTVASRSENASSPAKFGRFRKSSSSTP